MANPDDLYFIQIEPGPVKVGRSAKVALRLSQIQCASPYDAEVLFVLHGGGKYEYEVHYYLRHCRMRGEWFRWTEMVSDLIDLMANDGDWQLLLNSTDIPPLPADDLLRVGSPLYAGHPVYGVKVSA